MFAERRTHAQKGPGADTGLALAVQTALLPYALAIFAVSLPFFVWAGSFARNAVWMPLTFAIFAINWGAFYAITNWLKTPKAENLRKRLRLQVAGGLLWALSIVQMSIFADGAGPARETLLLLCAAAGMVCIFFAAPVPHCLAVVAPVAAAGPLWALFGHPDSRQLGVTAAGALALALAMAMIFNRMLRRQHALAVAHEALIEERLRVLEAAERTARSKSDIVATLSHEIRNGLTGVTHVLAAAAGKGGRAAPSREQLNAALDAAQDLISVLNATLDAETAETGRLSVETQAFEPVRLVRDLALLERPHALAKGLELSVHVDPSLDIRTLGAAVADPMRTRQIIANLVGNAVKYTVRGRVEVRIEPRGADRIAIEVADTGPGLSAEELEQAFEPFRRVERTGAGVNGAGLGLSLSRQLAKLMGGALETSSAMGVGSCFTLLLPYDAALPVPQEPVEETLAAADPAPDVQRSLRVLIAEDDALNAAMLRAILEQLGHQVVHAQNGRRAVDLAAVCEFDLVMLDGRMPVLDGPQTAAELRALPGANGQLPIIAVIGGDADEARECTEAGADTVLRKPVSVAGVARAVADAAALTRAPRTEASRGAA